MHDEFQHILVKLELKRGGVWVVPNTVGVGTQHVIL